MNAYVVVDTNVGIVANGGNEDASDACQLACINALEEVKCSKTVLLDSWNLILIEYGKHFTRAGEPGVGDAFFKWLHYHQGYEAHCNFVDITPTNPECTEFDEFPPDPELESFDLSDRKFVAVALASRKNPAILNATDSDWWDAEEALASNGVHVHNVCPEARENRN